MIRLTKKIFTKIYTFFHNLFIVILGFFYGRSKKCILIGAWGGTKFADNSRFLYQYLFQNKESLGLKRVIWVTREKKVNDLLLGMGYESYLIGTKKSRYWHLKCGVHIICNMMSKTSSFLPDIDVKYSAGAKRVQLWHGVGIKACKYMVSNAKEKKGLKLFYSKYLSYYFSPGFWENHYFLATSEENKRVTIADHGINPKKIIIAGYPRLTPCLKYTKDEKNIIDKIVSLKDKNKIVLFLPTFRESIKEYTFPQNIDGFDKFLEQNNIIWIQKSHSADVNGNISKHNNRIIALDSKFDINVLYDYIDLVITDYSSASSDAVYKNVLTLEYCPDYENYRNNDRGFVGDFDKYHIFEPVVKKENLFERIIWVLNQDLKSIKKHEEVKKFIFESENSSMDEIFNIIRKKIKI